MKLLILRHGQAEPHFDEGDAARQLTEHGRAQVAQICNLRAEALAQVRAIWASPFVRTQQTAAIVSQKLGLPVATQTFLVGEASPQAVLDALQQAEQWPLLLVSHQPLVGSLVNGLTGSGGAHPHLHPMGTASLACLSSEVWADGCADLDWLQHAE